MPCFGQWGGEFNHGTRLTKTLSGLNMSRDNTIFYMGNEFPSVEWAAILAEFDAESYPVKDLDRRWGASQRWCLDGVDGQIYVDLINAISGLHLAPPNCQWMIAIHCNGHIGIQHWFLYSLPILAVSRLGNSILFDPHFPNPGAACTLAGIEHRMHAVLPSRCNIERIAECVRKNTIRCGQLA